jgi:hypothetical protein
LSGLLQPFFNWHSGYIGANRAATRMFWRLLLIRPNTKKRETLVSRRKTSRALRISLQAFPASRSLAAMNPTVIKGPGTTANEKGLNRSELVFNGNWKNLADGYGSKMGALAAGAGTGTLMVVLAENLPDRPIKSLLILTAPAASSILSWIWDSVRSLVESRLREREKEQLFSRARGTIVEAMDDVHISAEYKEMLRRQLEELEMLKVSELYKRIKLMGSK